MVYTEPGGSGSSGENDSINFIANDTAGTVAGADRPFGGTTQVACHLDGTAVITP